MLHNSETPASPLLGPVDTQIAGLVKLSLPAAANIEECLFVIFRITQLFNPGTLQVVLEPPMQAAAKLLLLFAETKIHLNTLPELTGWSATIRRTAAKDPNYSHLCRAVKTLVVL